MICMVLRQGSLADHDGLNSTYDSTAGFASPRAASGSTACRNGCCCSASPSTAESADSHANVTGRMAGRTRKPARQRALSAVEQARLSSRCSHCAERAYGGGKCAWRTKLSVWKKKLWAIVAFTPGSFSDKDERSISRSTEWIQAEAINRANTVAAMIDIDTVTIKDKILKSSAIHDWSARQISLGLLVEAAPIWRPTNSH